MRTKSSPQVDLRDRQITRLWCVQACRDVIWGTPSRACPFSLPTWFVSSCRDMWTDCRLSIKEAASRSWMLPIPTGTLEATFSLSHSHMELLVLEATAKLELKFRIWTVITVVINWLEFGNFQKFEMSKFQLCGQLPPKCVMPGRLRAYVSWLVISVKQNGNKLY